MGKLADSAFPGIVDVVEQEEERFLIMEWIEGETLAAQMERDGAFAEETVIEIGICLAKAIQKLHRMQPPLLYLDCKPSNVMKDSDGKIRLIDFGSALEAHTPSRSTLSRTFPVHRERLLLFPYESRSFFVLFRTLFLHSVVSARFFPYSARGSCG